MSRSNRKRAADFLDDDEATPAVSAPKNTSKQPSKKSKKSANVSDTKSSKPQKAKKTKGQSLTADGVNGVIEHLSDSEVEITTESRPVEASLAAEGLRTADRELNDEDDSDEEEEPDQGAALLAGFDSDTEDPAEDKDLDPSKLGSIPDYKKTTKKLRNAAQKGSDGPGAVYVGRIPHGFYEKQMREYFSQFGDITKLRLSRNKRTGASKHFAFIEFSSNEVAKIVAETMDNYLMFGHILKCKYAPAENLHPDVWKGANKKFRKIPHQKLERQKLEAPKTVAQWEKKNQKEDQKRKKNAAKLKEIGYELPLPILKSPAAALEQRQLESADNETADVINGEVAESTSTKAIEAAPEKAKKVKKNRVQSDAANPLTEDNLGAQNAGHYEKAPKSAKKSVASSKPSAAASTTAQQSTTTAAPTASSKASKKSKKASKSNTEQSDKGEYDALSSIPIGIDAAGDESAQGGSSLDPESYGNIDTVNGVADAELKKRKKDRKKAKPVTPTSDELTAAAVNEIAPFAQDANKKRKAADDKVKAKKVKSNSKK